MWYIIIVDGYVLFQTIMPFLESEDDMLKILATLTLANIVDEEENKTLIAETGKLESVSVSTVCLTNYL